MTLVLCLALLPSAAFAEESVPVHEYEADFVYTEEEEPTNEEELVAEEEPVVEEPEDIETLSEDTIVEELSDEDYPTIALATGMATINISTLDGTDTNNSANAASQSQWTYNAANRVLTLSTYSGNYILTGANTNLSVKVEELNIKLTLNGAQIYSTKFDNYPLNVLGNYCVVTLIGNNILDHNIGDSYGATPLRINNDCVITTSSSSGSLLCRTVSSNNSQGIYLNEGVLNISESAKVSVDCRGRGILMVNNSIINVGQNAVLDVKAGAWGLLTGNGNKNLTLNSDGVTSITADVWTIVFNPSGLLTLGGKGTVTLTGKSSNSGKMISIDSNVRIGDDVTLRMINIGSQPATNTFQKSNTGSNYMWKVTGGTYTESVLKASINVTVKPGTTATVSRGVLNIPVPGSPKAVSSGYNSVKVSWAKVANACGYEVQRAASKGGIYSTVGTVTSGSTLSFNNTGLTHKTEYYYKVRAYVTDGGTRKYSKDSAIVNANPAGAVPANHKAASSGHTSVKVSWDKVAGANG